MYVCVCMYAYIYIYVYVCIHMYIRTGVWNKHSSYLWSTSATSSTSLLHVDLLTFCRCILCRLLCLENGLAYSGVCEINTHPTRRQCRTPPSPLMSMFTDIRKVSAIGLWNKHSLLLAAVGQLSANFEIRGAGSRLSKHKRHRDERLFHRNRYPIQGYWVCQNGFDERGARAYTWARMFGSGHWTHQRHRD